MEHYEPSGRQNRGYGSLVIKRLFLGVIAGLIILSEVGCVDVKKTVLDVMERDVESIADGSLTYLSDKYKREFSPVIFEERGILDKGDELHVKTDGMDEDYEWVTVLAVPDEDGSVIYSDDYFGFLVRDELEAYLTDLFKDDSLQVKLYAETQGIPYADSLGADSGLEDLFNTEPERNISIHAFIKKEDGVSVQEYEDTLYRYKRALLDSGHNYIVYVFVVEPELYEDMERYGTVREEFWRYYANHDEPDMTRYFCLLNEIIQKGEIL